MLLLLRRRSALMQQLRQTVLDALGKALHGGIELRYPPPVLNRVLGRVEGVDEALCVQYGGCTQNDSALGTGFRPGFNFLTHRHPGGTRHW